MSKRNRYVVNKTDEYMAWLTLLAKTIPYPEGCVVFPGGKFSNGYGQIKYNNYPIGTHRLSYILAFGPVPESLNILHRCKLNRACCNPGHLYAGTHSDNMQDRINDLTSPGQKLTSENVIEIRILRSGGSTLKSIAMMYNVSYGAVYKVTHNLSWKNV